jgi:hypothetical protein
MSGPRQARIVWSNTSDERKWDRKIAEMITSGEASPSDEFMRVGWMPPLAPDSEGCGPASDHLRSEPRVPSQSGQGFQRGAVPDRTGRCSD